MSVTTPSAGADSARIRSMFDRIAPTYDLLNRLISLGLDRKWRQRAVGMLGPREGGAYLDLAAGSGDVSLELGKHRPALVVGADFALNMLTLFRSKVSGGPGTGIPNPFAFIAADAHRLPFADRSFDGVITAFGVRNFSDRPRALKEMRRVLKAGGAAVILELTRPARPIVRFFHDVHVRRVLPALGKLISGDGGAYVYLPDSIGAFPSAREFTSMMREAGFESVSATPFSFGAVTAFFGKKPSG